MPQPPNGSPVRRRPSSPGQAPSASRPRRASSSGVSKLVCTAGPASGQEFLLEGVELVVGRASENAISIPDTSVSRRHVTVKQVSGAWVAVDLGSGNGTLINGSQISDETPLNDGDVISLGDTDLRFHSAAPAGGSSALSVRRSGRGGEQAEEPSAMARSVRRPVRTLSRSMARRTDPEFKAKQKQLKVRIAIAVAVIALPLLGWKLKQSLDASRVAQVEAQRQKAVNALRVIQQDAKRLVREGKWAEAKEKFDEIVQRDQSFESATVADYLRQADKEIPNQKLFTEARAAIAEGKMTEASVALEKVSPDTFQGELRAALKNDLDTLIARSLEKARLLLAATSDEAQMNRLLAISQDVLGARPEQRDALEFKKLALDAIERIKDGRKPPPPPADTSERAVQQRYNDGDFNTAFSMAQACANKNAKCRALQGMIKEFIGAYGKLESASPPELMKLAVLDRKISAGSGGKSVMSKKIGVQLVGRGLIVAQRAKSNRDWAKASEYAEQILQVDEDNVQARAIVSEAAAFAKETYQQAYQVKDTDPEMAIRLFREVIGATSKDNELNQKARGWLKKMGQ